MMVERTREWLRNFLMLGARAGKDGIPWADIERQEDTVLRALDMLDSRPGVILADEVGMGKTYEALGIAAAIRHQKKNGRIVVVTPGPDLNAKWFSEFARFKELFNFGEQVVAAGSLAEFVQFVRTHAVVVAPVTMFQSGRGSEAQTYLLSLYFHWKQFHGHTVNAIMSRFRDGSHDWVDVTSERFLDVFDLKQVEPHLRKAFRRGSDGGPLGLDDLYEAGGLAAFESQAAVRSALYRARFVLTGKLMPTIDLLIVDEAHKLKNEGSLRTQAMRGAFDGRFRKALFLTATPFQLHIGELKEVFSLFARAKHAPPNLEENIEDLLASVADYQRQYEVFQQTWSSLDPLAADRFCALYDDGIDTVESIEEPGLRNVAQQVAGLKALKTEKIEPGFRQWMIRSLREEKRTYRRHVKETIRSDGAGALPFLIYERYIAELFRRRRQTHKAAVEINMVSSYAAARQGAILSSVDGIPAEAQLYRNLLREILGEIHESAHDHSKISYTVSDALDAADRGEKTLIFCSRTATLEQLRRELDTIWEARVLKRWQRIYPDAGASDIFDTSEGDDKSHRGKHSLLRARFHRSQDALYLALREPYLRTLARTAEWALLNLSSVVAEANRILLDVRVGTTAAKRLDYLVAKRCVEQAALRLHSKIGDLDTEHPDALRKILDPHFVRLGLDLVQDEYEVNSWGDEKPQWQISERIARMVIGGGGSLWEEHSALLSEVPPTLRVRIVEQLARYLTYKQVPFLPDLLEEAKASGLTMDHVESAALLEFMPNFWRTERGRRWQSQLQTFLSYFLQRDPQQQLEILDGPIRTGDFARHTRDGENRERLREAFNTPLYPMILIANEVMQEGLDLHKHCRRVVHHDLVWNPAQIEQRVGRIDRLGSLTSRLRKDGGKISLDVLYPVIRGTIDERLYRTVKRREKWLEFLLGAPPNFSEYALSDDEPPPLPDNLSTDLAIDLSPN